MDDTDERHAPPNPTASPLTLTVQSAAELASVRSRIRQWLRPSIASVETDEVLLAGGEALSNALEHGQPPITVSLAWTGERVLNVRVEDSGPWRVSGETTSRGLGIPIMTALMDSVSVETTDGTTIQLTRRFKI